MNNDFENSKFIEERLDAIKNFETSLKKVLGSLYKTNLSIAIKEGKARAKKLREEQANDQKKEKE